MKNKLEILSPQALKDVCSKCKSLEMCKRPAFVYKAKYALPIFFFSILIGLIFLPWQQTSFGTGSVIAYNPNERIQEIQSPVSGIVSKWHVLEGSRVKADDPIADISDIDPLLLERLENQRKQSLTAMKAVQEGLLASKNNLSRQKSLAKQGLKSQRDFEKARMEYAKLESELAVYRNKLTDIESKLARQSSQQIKSPRDGIIMKIMLPQASAVVQSGDVLVKIVPQANKKIVEAYLSAVDMPFLRIGRKVSVQFEGWPVIQISGYPSIAVGVFRGTISFIDPGTTPNGTIRVFVSEDKKSRPWPSATFLRQGNRVKIWVLLEQVSLGYEIWRRLNAFPPELTSKMGKKDLQKQKDLFFKSLVK